MEVAHKTPFCAGLMPILDKDGTEGRVAVLKATFSLGDHGLITIAEQQESVQFIDTYLNEPATSSTLFESDGAWFKPATDIVVIGSAFAPEGGATTFTARIDFGPLSKRLAVFGDRHWSYSTLTGTSISEPERLSEIPLCWERCFGGSDLAGNQTVWEPRNPIGTGFCAVKRAEKLNGLPLPNFEDPSSSIRRWDDRPTPHGLGFVGRSWQPRVRHAGTYDAVWQRTRMPIPPADFDYRFFNGAAPGLVFPGYVRGGEMVQASNLSPRRFESFTLPSLDVVFRGVARRAPFEIEGRADTVLLDFRKSRVIITYRAKYSVFQNEPADLVRAIVSGWESCR